MAENELKSWHWILIIIGAILLPLILNWVILRPSIFPFVGEGKDWLMFWVTYISAIASFAMVFITWRTLRQNKEQVDELKHQWEEQNRARLSVVVILTTNDTTTKLKITNVGKQNAYAIKIKFNEDFLETLPSKIRVFYDDHQNKIFAIEAGASKYLPIGGILENANYKKQDTALISIKGTYCEKYTIDETLNICEYLVKGMKHNENS